MVAANAVERRLAALTFKEPMVPTVVIEPQDEEKQADHHAENHGACCDIDHRRKPNARRWPRKGAKRASGFDLVHRFTKTFTERIFRTFVWSMAGKSRLPVLNLTVEEKERLDV
ncbi:MAG: hypothetical protein WC378_10180, partial [Opitutaceae bacterium]